MFQILGKQILSSEAFPWFPLLAASGRIFKKSSILGVLSNNDTTSYEISISNIGFGRLVDGIYLR